MSLVRNLTLKLRVGLGFVLVVFITAVPALSSIAASSIAQGFRLDDQNVVAGAIVSFKVDPPNAIELATLSNVDRMIGVASGKGESLIELSAEEGYVQIVTSGVANTLVSDMNGRVRSGDKITISPVSGVGMKAPDGVLAIGTAQADLQDVDTKTTKVTDKQGKERSIKVGSMAVHIDKTYTEPVSTSPLVPPALYNLAYTVAGHQVSPARIIVVAFLMLMLFVVVTVLIYTAIRSSIVSIGRNPLSESAVRRSLARVIAAVVGLISATLFVVYLILIT